MILARLEEPKRRTIPTRRLPSFVCRPSSKIRDSRRPSNYTEETDHSSGSALERFSKRVGDELDTSLANSYRASWKERSTGNVQLNNLNFTGLNKLYGRDAEVEDLLDTRKSLVGTISKSAVESPSGSNGNDEKAAQKKEQQQCKLISIFGPSGSGKSALARKLETPIVDGRGYFVAGEFNSQHQISYSAFTRAFSELCDKIDNEEEGRKKEVTTKIVESVGETNMPIVVAVIPDLARIIDIDIEMSNMVEVCNTDVATGSAEMKNRLNYLLLKFTRAVCSPEHPLVVLLDDVHLADDASLELLRDLMGDTENSSLLVLTTFTTGATEMEDCRYIAMTKALEEYEGLEKKIVLENLNAAAVNSIVCHLLRSSEETVEIKSLADVIHEKTLGNALFVLEVMKMLTSEELLKFNFGSMKWQWENHKIGEISVTGNVVDLLVAKLLQMPLNEQFFLQVASCLGRSFDELAFKSVMTKIRESEFGEHFTEKELDIQGTLNAFVEQGILDFDGIRFDIGNERMKFKFAHSQIQDAAFVSISEQLRPKLSLFVGASLISFGEVNDELDEIIFVALDLYGQGSELIRDQDEKTKLAGYATLAGNKALRQGDFSSAAKYMDAGLSYLGEERWTNHKELTLHLSSSLADAFYSMGNFDMMQPHIDQVLHRTDVEIGGKIRVYRALIRSLGAQERFGEAIDKGIQALKELKVVRKLSKNAGLLSVLNELRKTQSLLKSNSTPLEYLPDLTDKRRINAMEIVYMMTTMMYIVNPNLFLIMYAKIVRWNIKYGVCQYSPNYFAGYGVIKCGVLGDMRGGYELGEKALALSERLCAKETESKMVFTFYAFIHHWSKYLRDAAEPLLFGFQVGLETGDVEAAFFNLGHLMMNGMITGSVKLDTLSERMKDSCQKMKDYKQNAVRSFTICLWQLALNLSGQSVDPFILTGEAMNEEDMFRTIKETQNIMLEPFLYSLKMQLLFILGQYTEALDCAKKAADYGVKISQGEPLVPRHTFFSGLAFIVNGQIKKGRKILKKMKSWVRKGNINCLHQVQLLIAELASVSGKNDAARKAFDDAVKSAGVGSFVNDRALIHERAAIHYLKIDDTYWAAYHFNSSIKMYESWSATEKVRQIKEKRYSILCKQAYQ